MNYTPWEKAMSIRSLRARIYQKKLLEYEKAQANNFEEKAKIIARFEKELKVIVDRVLEITTNFNVTTIFIHINEKPRKFLSNVVKVSVSAEGEYTRNVYFHCSCNEARAFIEGALKKNSIPYEESTIFDGLVIKIV